jgi:hypothetical protein
VLMMMVECKAAAAAVDKPSHRDHRQVFHTRSERTALE